MDSLYLSKMRALLLLSLVSLLFVGVIWNAYYRKGQFYPTVAYLTNSTLSMAVIYLEITFIFTFLLNLMKKLFFGELAQSELEGFVERTWYAVAETFLTFSIFKDEFDSNFLILLIIITAIKGFHWLADERVNLIERRPVIALIDHFKIVSVQLLLIFIDVTFVINAVNKVSNDYNSGQIVLGFECGIMFTYALNSIMKYNLHTLENIYSIQNKVDLLLFSELVAAALRITCYVVFTLIMIEANILPLFSLRQVCNTVSTLKHAFNDLLQSRAVVRNMNRLADANEEELEADDSICIICRYEMKKDAKILSCKHIFHTVCLRSWFRKQQSCPTCRLPVFSKNVRIDENIAEIDNRTQSGQNQNNQEPTAAVTMQSSSTTSAAPSITTSSTSSLAPHRVSSSTSLAAPLRVSSSTSPAAPLSVSSSTSLAAPLRINSSTSPVATHSVSSSTSPAAPYRVNSSTSSVAPHRVSSSTSPAAPYRVNSSTSPVATHSVSSSTSPAAPHSVSSSTSCAAISSRAMALERSNHISQLYWILFSRKLNINSSSN